MKNLIKFNEYYSYSDELEDIQYLFFKYSDIWGLKEVDDINEYSSELLENNIYCFNMTDEGYHWTNFELSILFRKDYGECGVKGKGKTNTNCDYLSQDFQEDMKQYVKDLEKIGYKNCYIDFRGGYPEFLIKIRK